MAEFAVVLVDPLYEGNVGHVARSMMNFGTTDLRIVKGVALTDEGRDRAVHAQRVLDEARRTETLAEAAEGLDLLVGFTARMTGREEKYRRNPLDLRDWAPKAVTHPGRIGLVFGREDRGLENAETDQCDVLVAIPTHEMYRSMNLAHAVSVALWTLYAQTDVHKVKAYTPASKEQIDRLVVRFHQLMEASDYPEHKRETVRTMIRRLLARADPTAWEMHTFLGLLRDTLYHLGNRRERDDMELPPEQRRNIDLDLATLPDLDAWGDDEATSTARGGEDA